MGLLLALLRICIRAALPTPRCLHGHPWNDCDVCNDASRRDPFRRR